MRENGTLIFRVYTSDADIPVEGATAAVFQTDPPGGLLGIRVTDSSGETDPIAVPAPDRALSQTPETAIRPWTTLRALVEHPSYEKVTLEGLQIFPGVETIQNIQLIPRQEFDPRLSGQEDFFFTPQPIWEGSGHE